MLIKNPESSYEADGAGGDQQVLKYLAATASGKQGLHETGGSYL